MAFQVKPKHFSQSLVAVPRLYPISDYTLKCQPGKYACGRLRGLSLELYERILSLPRQKNMMNIAFIDDRMFLDVAIARVCHAYPDDAANRQARFIGNAKL